MWCFFLNWQKHLYPAGGGRDKSRTGHTDATGDDDDPAGVVVQEVEEEDGLGPEIDEDALEGEAPEVLLPLGQGVKLLWLGNYTQCGKGWIRYINNKKDNKQRVCTHDQ